MREVVLVGKDYRCSAVGDTTINESMSIYCCADLGYKEVAGADAAAVEMQGPDVFVYIAYYLNRG